MVFRISWGNSYEDKVASDKDVPVADLSSLIRHHFVPVFEFLSSSEHERSQNNSSDRLICNRTTENYPAICVRNPGVVVFDNDPRGSVRGSLVAIVRGNHSRVLFSGHKIWQSPQGPEFELLAIGQKEISRSMF